MKEKETQINQASLVLTDVRHPKTLRSLELGSRRLAKVLAFGNWG